MTLPLAGMHGLHFFCAKRKPELPEQVLTLI
jgi:hypothetical protein